MNNELQAAYHEAAAARLRAEMAGEKRADLREIEMEAVIAMQRAGLVARRWDALIDMAGTPGLVCG